MAAARILEKVWHLPQPAALLCTSIGSIMCKMPCLKGRDPSKYPVMLVESLRVEQPHTPTMAGATAVGADVLVSHMFMSSQRTVMMMSPALPVVLVCVHFLRHCNNVCGVTWCVVACLAHRLCWAPASRRLCSGPSRRATWMQLLCSLSRMHWHRRTNPSAVS
jgi:hypothetical protein